MAIQRSVQQQNQITFDKLLLTGRHFREQGVPAAIRRFLADRDIDIDTSAVVSAQTNPYMLGFAHGLAGLLVTKDKRFFEFEIELDPSLSKVLAIHTFSDVTASQNMSAATKGTGKGDGYLAVAVLTALNGA